MSIEERARRIVENTTSDSLAKRNAFYANVVSKYDPNGEESVAVYDVAPVDLPEKGKK